MRSARHRRPGADRAGCRRRVRDGARQGRFVPGRASGVGKGGAEDRGGGFGGGVGEADDEVWGERVDECRGGELWDVGSDV